VHVSGQCLDAPFQWRGEEGAIHVECVPNDDPNFWWCWHSSAHGFPVCTASVEYPPLGYRSMLGWVQLVRSSDNESAGADFEIDPFSLFGDAPAPYCWYGQRPTLFDAPSRPRRAPLEWTAHSFLAATPLEEVASLRPRRVVPLVGFAWEFTDTVSEVFLHDVIVLSEGSWDTHVDTLRRAYPLWVFPRSQDA
jgi:hypothetical protein